MEKIVEVIELLVDVTKDASDVQEENMEQANALALQLCVIAEENGKFKLKEFLSNTTANGLILGLQVFLNQHGLL